MNNHRLTTTAFCLISLFTASAAAGPYLDQPPPGREPALFAPGIVSDGLPNRDMAITPDGREIYWSSNLREFGISAILVSRQTDEGWTEPEVAPFSRDPSMVYYEPHVAPDGERFFFVAQKTGHENNDIWVMDREGNGWSKARKMDAPINSKGKEYFPSLTRDGTMYLTREDGEAGTEAIYRSRLVDGKYTEPERLPEQVNSGQSRFNAFVDPDERFIIVPVVGGEDSAGAVDYYVVFRNEADEWSEPVNLGDKINTPGHREWTPYVSPDGKYFFFMSTRTPAKADAPAEGYTKEHLDRVHAGPENGNSDIYWIDASVIRELKPEGF